MNKPETGDSRPPSDPSESELRPYPIRLEDVFCLRPAGHRRERREEDPADPQFKVSVSRSTLSEDRRTFGARLRVQGSVPLEADEIATADVTVHGTFVSDGEIDDEHFAAFTDHTPLVMLWPFARSYFADIGRMMGVALPTLPTLDASRPSEEAQPAPPAEG